MENEVVALGAENREEIVAVIADAFFDYPVMRYILGTDGDYPARLRALLDFFTLARLHRGERMYGVRRDGRLAGVALTSHPEDDSRPPKLLEARDRTWDELGVGARARYETFGSTVIPFPEEPHLHLNILAVARGAQGSGVGRSLLEAVQQASRERPGSTGVSLSTEKEGNVALYEHCGYEVLGSARVDDAFTSWSMFRRNA